MLLLEPLLALPQLKCHAAQCPAGHSHAPDTARSWTTPPSFFYITHNCHTSSSCCSITHQLPQHQHNSHAPMAWPSRRKLLGSLPSSLAHPSASSASHVSTAAAAAAATARRASAAAASPRPWGPCCAPLCTCAAPPAERGPRPGTASASAACQS